MGGRGAVSSSGKIGLMSNAGQTMQAQVQVDDTQVASAFSASYDKFMAMSDDEKADFIDANIKQGVPAHLAQNDFQKFVYNSGMNEKPDVVDDATLDTMTGTEIFRTVNNVYDSRNDLSYNADQIAKQVMAGRVTRVSDNGGSVYGRGIYFADNYGDSAGYGNTTGNVKKTAVIRGKLNNNAKVINYYTASSAVKKEISSGSKLGKTLKKCDSASQVSIYAMSKGFNVISNGSTYLNVLNRNAITMSSSVKASKGWQCTITHPVHQPKHLGSTKQPKQQILHSNPKSVMYKDPSQDPQPVIYTSDKDPHAESMQHERIFVCHLPHLIGTDAVTEIPVCGCCLPYPNK